MELCVTGDSVVAGLVPASSREISRDISREISRDISRERLY